MDDGTRTTSIDIQPGADVFGSDGERLGAIIEVSDSYVVVEKGLFFPTDYFIPVAVVTAADPGKVTLSVTRDKALTMGWDQEPSERDNSAVATEPSTEAGDAADESDARNPEPETAGMAAMLGTIPPAADFATLGVAPMDVNPDYHDARSVEPEEEAADERDSRKE